MRGRERGLWTGNVLGLGHCSKGAQLILEPHQTCIYWYAKRSQNTLLHNFFTDIDECMVDCICGGGNFLQGSFYTCLCYDGFELTGDPSIHSFSCTGKSRNE